MIYPYQIVAIWGISFLLGILVASYFNVAAPLLLVGSILFVVPLLLKPKPLVKVVAVAGIGLLLGWWRYESAVNLPNNLVSRWADQTVEVEGVIASDPGRTDNRQQFQLRAHYIDGQPAFGKILITTWLLPPYQYGDRVLIKAVLSKPAAYEGFNYPTYLAKDGIYALGNSVGETLLIEGANPSVLGWLYQVKYWFAGKVNQFLPNPHNALLNGLLLGQRAQLSDSFKDALKNSGTTHIIALSGFNVTIIAGFFLYLLRRTPRKLGLILAAIGVLLFVLMTGASSSVIRAATMGWILLLVSLWGRRRSIINAVVVAVVAMVVINPLILQHDAGFQLSVAATIGLIFLTPHFLNLFRFFPPILKETTATTMGAILFTLPLVIFDFGGFSSVALLANILVVPLVPVTMFLGFGMTILFILIPFLHFLNLIVLAATGLLIKIIDFFGNLPYAFVAVAQLPSGWVAVYYIAMVVVVYWYSSVRSRHA